MRSVTLLRLLLVLFVFCTSCQNKNNDVICTASFASFNVYVADSTGRQAVLDSTITLTPSGQRLVITEIRDTSFHSYTIVDDGYQRQLANRTEVLRFLAYKAGLRVVDTPYTISADDCHVSKVSGPDSIRLK